MPQEGPHREPRFRQARAISKAKGFPPAVWFGDADEEGRASDDALLAALKDGTVRAILEEAQRMRPKDRRLLGIARQIGLPTKATKGRL